MQEITLTLTVEETNLVLEALGNLPFARVYSLIQRLQGQATEQIRARQAAPTAPADGGKTGDQ